MTEVDEAADGPAPDERPAETDPDAFLVDLEVFSGPFDVLLHLISKKELDVTEVALAEVTDDFLAHVAVLRQRQDAGASSLEALSHFLLVAATLLDLKTARLLPRSPESEELDLEVLEARDLLFARLLQYRAFKKFSARLREAIAEAGTRVGRDVPLEEEFGHVLPPLRLRTSADALALLYATALTRDTAEPRISLDHIHVPEVSVSEQRELVTRMLEENGRVSFAELVAEAGSTLEVVARFLALLEMFKEGLCRFDQPEPLGELEVYAIEEEETRTDA